MSTLASALTAVPSLEHTQTALGLSVYQQAGLFPLQWRFVTVVVNQQSWGLYLQVLMSAAQTPPSTCTSPTSLLETALNPNPNLSPNFNPNP